VDSPPTFHQGAVLFGSADGWVYCLRASDGQLAWRFRAAPEERLIGAFDQLESAWPVHGSVLVQNGAAYFAAGRTSQLDGGIRLYGVSAATGQLLHQTKLEGPDYALDSAGQLVARPSGIGASDEAGGRFEENFRLPMGSLPDVLMGDGANIYMRTIAFDGQLRRQPRSEKPSLQTKSGFLEDSYFKRAPWTFGSAENYARLIIHDNQSAYFVRMFDTLRGLDPTVYFTPGGKGYLLFAKNMNTDRSTWSLRIPVRVRAMVLCAGRLFVAGPPDILDPKDPLGAFEGRKGGLLFVFDSASGQKIAEHSLPSPPVFNGAAAANGRLYIVAEDGAVTCFGKP
jgi:outer membrane protein assembly factor BamB